MEYNSKNSVDDEWSAFVGGLCDSLENTSLNDSPKSIAKWLDAGLNVPDNRDTPAKCVPFMEERVVDVPLSPPDCGKLHISTKTKVLFLNCEIDTTKTFWSIPLVEYWQPKEGVIKKQIKITSSSQEELDESLERLKLCGTYYTEMIIKNTISASAAAPTFAAEIAANLLNGVPPPPPKRLKFKDDRKITIGISKKDIMNCRGKPKKAFMNCFAIIIRVKYLGEFREVHVKVFNTGKLEIPGVPEDEMLDVVREKVIEYLQPHLGVNPLQYIRGNGDGGDEDVLINSGFHCGFCINQKAFYSILRSEKYGIETSYDSCHYPGIRCKYYYRNGLAPDHPEQDGRIGEEDNGIKMSQLELSKKYTCVSFMIFSTGNCLVVGNCSKAVLLHVFEFIKRTLAEEYGAICLPTESTITKLKKKKQRKKTVNMQMQYYTLANSKAANSKAANSKAANSKE
jgi:hypothetical protein